MAFDVDALRDILVCPRSHSALVLDETQLVSVDPDCRLAYEIRDGIPIMLADDALELPHDEWAAVMSKHGREPTTGQRVEQ